MKPLQCNFPGPSACLSHFVLKYAKYALQFPLLDEYGTNRSIDIGERRKIQDVHGSMREDFPNALARRSRLSAGSEVNYCNNGPTAFSD